MTKHALTMPVKRGGKIFPPGERLEFTADELSSLRRANVTFAPADPKSDDDGGASDFDLKSALTNLLSDGHDIKAMNMADTIKLLGRDARGVKRADVDAALKEIDAEMAAKTETAIKAITGLGDKVRDEQGTLVADKVHEILKPGETYTAAIIDAAIAELTSAKGSN